MGETPNHRFEPVTDGEPAYGQITGPDGDTVIYDPENPKAWVRSTKSITIRR